MLRASNPREADAPPEDSVNAVQVMTVHSAKGLEFPVVFVAAMHKGIDTSQPVVAFSRRYGLGARWRNPAKREDKDDLFQHAIREERSKRELEESHRLLYVAMTRAEQHLVLSFSGKAQWAGVVAKSLDLDIETSRDRILTCRAPDGKSWKLRLLVTDQAPELLMRDRSADTAEKADGLVDPPAVSGQHDGNCTATSLAVFANCPRKYYLGHYLGFEGRRRGVDGAGTVTAAGSDFGTQVHTLLAGTVIAEASPEATRLAGVFRNSPLGRRVARATRAEREFDFLLAVEGVVIRGQVDLWFEEGGELVVVDYKTDSVTAVEAHRRAQDYTLQLQLYAMAVERIAGRPPDRAWLFFLRSNTAVEVDLRLSLWDSPEQVVRDLGEAQSTLMFPLNEGERCRRCDFYKGFCPSSWDDGKQ